MCKALSMKGIPRYGWLKMRKTGIGGSDAGAVCGLNPYSSPMKVYLDKTSEEVEDIDSETMRQGRDLEDYVATRFEEETGKKVRRTNKMYYHEELPFMLADIDRFVVGEDAGLECKTVSAYNADKWKDGKIPAHYAIQCYHYMAVTGKRTWYIAAVILGKDFLYRKIDWDEAVIRSLIEIESNFWRNHVMKKVMPDPDGSKVCDEILLQYFSSARNEEAVELGGYKTQLDRRCELDDLIRKLETERNQIDQNLKLALGDSQYGLVDKYRVSWTNVETRRLDTKKMKKELPDVYDRFSVINSSRRFSVHVA